MSKRPHHLAALFSALQFRRPCPESLLRLDDGEWDRLLAFADRVHLTLILGRLASEYMPDHLQERIARNLADNTERVARIQLAYEEIAEQLSLAGASHLVLKGFSQWPNFVTEPCLRMQSDIDLYCPGDSLPRARDVLLKLGYQWGRVSEKHLGDHLFPLVRMNGWQWRGNMFDPEMPPSVELHYQFWGARSFGFGPVDLGAFWSRRTEKIFNTICYSSLHPVDGFAYSALHALRHLLDGGLLVSHIYELAFFLHRNADNTGLWETWLHWHDDQLRRLAAIPSMLAAEWFNCRLPAAVTAEINRLPKHVERWFRAFPDSPLETVFRPNKDALWLHLGLIDSHKARFSVLLRRLFPLWFPSLDSRWVQEGNGSLPVEQRGRWQKYVTYGEWFAHRTVRHMRELPRTLWSGLRLLVN